jgi:hypothetical protein
LSAVNRLLNTSGTRLSAGDHVAWTLNPRHHNVGTSLAPEKKLKLGCRRVGIVKCFSSFDPQMCAALPEAPAAFRQPQSAPTHTQRALAAPRVAASARS